VADYLMIRAQDVDRVMISDRYKNLELRAKGTVTLDTPLTTNTTTSCVTGTVTFAGGANPVIAVAGGKCGMLSLTVSGSTFTFTLVADAARTVTYYIFDEPVATVSNYGLVVRNAAGEVTFDALKKYMRVVATISGVPTDSTPLSVPIPAGRTCAIVLGYSGSNLTIIGGLIGGGPTWLVTVNNSLAMATISGATAIASRERLYYFQTSGNNGMPTPDRGVWGTLGVNYLVVDVTNY